MNPWEVLGIEHDAEEGEVRRAYAARLKHTRPDEDAQAFQRLRAAYEFALQHARDMQGLPSDAAPSVSVSVASVEEASAEDDADPHSLDAATAQILDACSPVSFDPALVRELVASLPELVSLTARAQVGHRLAYHVADGVALNPHSLLLLEELFGWNDIGIVAADPVFRDVRFVERMQRAHLRSRPSTRQHQTPPAAGIGIGMVVMMGLVQATKFLKGDGPHASAGVIRSQADLVIVIALAVIGALLLGFETWASTREDVSDGLRRTRLIVRIVAGVLLVAGVLYFVGRP